MSQDLPASQFMHGRGEPFDCADLNMSQDLVMMVSNIGKRCMSFVPLGLAPSCLTTGLRVVAVVVAVVPSTASQEQFRRIFQRTWALESNESRSPIAPPSCRIARNLQVSAGTGVLNHGSNPSPRTRWTMRMMAMALSRFTLGMGESARVSTATNSGCGVSARPFRTTTTPGPVLDIGRFCLVWGRYRGSSRRKGKRASNLAAVVLLRIARGVNVPPLVSG